LSNGKHYVKYIDEGIVGLTVGEFLSFEVQFDSRVAVGFGGVVVIDAAFEYSDYAIFGNSSLTEFAMRCTSHGHVSTCR